MYAVGMAQGFFFKVTVLVAGSARGTACNLAGRQYCRSRSIVLFV